MSVQILRPSAVAALRGKTRAGHYADIASGLYPAPVKIGRRASGWPDYEVDALQAACIAGKSPDEIRALVKRLEAKRQEAAA